MWRWARGLQQGKHGGSQVWIKPLQGGDQVGEETHRVVILGLERQPGDGGAALGKPVSHQRGFAETCRGGDEGERTLHPLLESLEEARAADERSTQTRHVEFGRQEGIRRIALRPQWCRREVSLSSPGR